MYYDTWDSKMIISKGFNALKPFYEAAQVQRHREGGSVGKAEGEGQGATGQRLQGKAVTTHTFSARIS